MLFNFFIDANGNYFEAIDPIELPEGAISVPKRPAYYWNFVDGIWVEGDIPPQPVPASISFAQLLIGLVTEGWISEADGEAWLAGTLPAPVLTLIASLPASQQFAAKARAIRPSEVLRADPLVVALGSYTGKTEAEIDTFFRTYSQA